LSEEEKTKILWWVVGAILGSVGLNQGINKSFQEVRYDPYTGTQGRLVREQLDKLERRVDGIDREQWRMIERMKRREEEAEKCRVQLDNHFRSHP